jgi:tRNA(Arg) A34 adenosine deaminase TadA
MSDPSHEIFMARAIELACQNLKRPFGSVIVDTEKGEVISEGLNKNYTNPIMHSDIAAINALVHECDEVDWSRCALYATAEPNAMCMAAILWTGIPQVYYGTPLEKLHTLGFRHIAISAQEVIDRADQLDCQLTGGVRQQECDELFTAAARLDRQTSPT